MILDGLPGRPSRLADKPLTSISEDDWEVSGENVVGKEGGVLMSQGGN